MSLDARGGYVNPAQIEVQPGRSIDRIMTLPTPTKGNPHSVRPLFIDWFTTPTTGGRRIRYHSIAPNYNMTIFARWSDPNVHLPLWWPPAYSGTTTIPLRLHYGQRSDRWQSNIRRAINNWNNSSANVEFDARSNAIRQNDVFIENRHDRWLGLCLPLGWRGSNITSFEIVLNANQIYSEANSGWLSSYGLDTIITWVMAHELGHAVGLQDQFGTTDSVMSNSTPRVTPSSFDINNVNIIYG